MKLHLKPANRAEGRQLFFASMVTFCLVFGTIVLGELIGSLASVATYLIFLMVLLLGMAASGLIIAVRSPQ